MAVAAWRRRRELLGWLTGLAVRAAVYLAQALAVAGRPENGYWGLIYAGLLLTQPRLRPAGTAGGVARLVRSRERLRQEAPKEGQRPLP